MRLDLHVEGARVHPARWAYPRAGTGDPFGL